MEGTDVLAYRISLHTRICSLTSATFVSTNCCLRIGNELEREGTSGRERERERENAMKNDKGPGNNRESSNWLE
jgi:hypothetical protein